MKYPFPILLVFFFSTTPFFSFGQTGEAQLTMGKISRPEKCWALGHPFLVKKTIRLTKEALHVADSIHNTRILKGSMSGGQPDAFKHAYWMALLARETSARKAHKLGKAHEKGNYLTYKKAKKKGLADPHNKLSSEMDLWNNKKGIEIGSKNKNIPVIQLQQILIDSIKSGAMRIIGKGSLLGENILVPSDHGPDW